MCSDVDWKSLPLVNSLILGPSFASKSLMLCLLCLVSSLLTVYSLALGPWKGRMGGKHRETFHV